MTTFKAGISAAACVPEAHTPPAHYLRRLARMILIRAAVRGRISWLVCIRMLALIDGAAADAAASTNTKREG